MAELRRVTASEIKERLASAKVSVPSQARTTTDVDGERRLLRETVALAGPFDAGDLPKADPATLRSFIAEDCERVPTRSGSRWSLRADVRANTIRTIRDPRHLLGAVERLRTDPEDFARQMATAYIGGSAPALDEQDDAQLRGSLWAAEWLAPLEMKGLPKVDHVRGRIELSNVLRPLTTLLAGGFVGRERELRVLRDHVEPTPRQLRRGRRGLLAVHGPGGVGKSTLIAKFVVDHVKQGTKSVAFSYLSFDRSDLSADRPLDMLGESARQLAAQFPDLSDAARELEHAARVTVAREVASSLEGYESTPGDRPTDEDIDRLVERYRRFVSRIGRRTSALVWVLDTFEHVQRQGEYSALTVLDFVDRLQQRVPNLRVVVAGRAPIPGAAASIALQGFDPPMAVAFLERELSGVAVDAAFLRAVAGQVSSLPLSLKLAGTLIRNEGREALSDLRTRRRLLFKLSAEEVQGILYRRILDHIADPLVRRIASPGLVVRRITTDVIVKVLKEPCGLGDLNDGQVRSLFFRLQNEAALVELEGDALVHRQDVRATMLPMLARDNPDVVRSIHEAAVAYYENEDGVVARAEELYHRLALDQPAEVLDARWDSSAASRLEVAIDELPATAQAYLGQHLGVQVDHAVLARVDDEAWARQTVLAAERALNANDPPTALEVVRKRRSPVARRAVAVLEVDALRMLRRYEEALDVISAVAGDSYDDVDEEVALALAVRAADANERLGRFDVAFRRAQHAKQLAALIGDEFLELTAGVMMLRLLRRTGRWDDELRQQVKGAAAAFGPRERARHPYLMRDLAAEIGDKMPELIEEAAELVGVDIQGASHARLEQLLSTDDLEEFAGFVASQREPGTDSEPPSPEPDMPPGRAATSTAAEQGHQVAQFLRRSPDHAEEWRAALAEVFRDEVDKG